MTPLPLKGEAEADEVGLGGGGHVSAGAASRAGEVCTVAAGGDRVGLQLGPVSIPHAAGSTETSEVADSEASFRPPAPS